MSDEWFENVGNICPVHPDIMVEIRQQNGSELTGKAGQYDWEPVKEYRLVPDHPVPIKPGEYKWVDDKSCFAHAPKQERYQDDNGEDWIDEFARTKTVEEFRGAMSFNIGKYNRRCGKKDEVIKEVKKIADYAQRWVQYEIKLLSEEK